jgi:hypothetical protein
MSGTMVWTFLGLAVIFGPLVGLGTRSFIRGLFMFLVFLGLVLSALLTVVKVPEVVSFFLGQIIVMAAACGFLKLVRPESLTRVKQEFSKDGGGSCH